MTSYMDLLNPNLIKPASYALVGLFSSIVEHA